MAGWDHELDVDVRDIDLALDCFKLLRRTCARHRVEFTYYREARDSGPRMRFVLAYNLQSIDMPSAVAEFAIEMRAVSTLERDPRRKRLPLRILRDVAWHGSYPSAMQLDEGDSPVPADRIEEIADLLAGFEAVWHAWHVQKLSAADFLEAQHSLVIGLALALVSEAKTKDNYPTLVEKLGVDSAMTDALKRLGANRREVKHLGRREHAREYANQGLGWVTRLIANKTGVWIDPLSPDVALLGEDPTAVFEAAPMYWRSGERRVVRR